MELIKFVFSNFWTWLGFMFIFALLLTFIIKVYNRIFRHRSIMRHGYPPAHCDADGDFPDNDDE